MTLTLRNFVREAWHVLEPSTPYVDGWHIGAICEHLEACTRGQIRNLIINIPPRHMKSLAVSVFWPMWVWTVKPESRWLFSSYAASLSVRDSVKCRRLIESPWYQKHFGSVFQLTSDQNQKTRFENNRTGYRLATSVGGTGTGEGGHFIVCDDGHNVKQAESDLQRESAVEWWRTTMSTRGNDPKTTTKVIVMQRLHQRDLTGEMLSEGLGYEHLCLPARFDSNHPTTSRTSLNFTDPRTKEGELLWPEQMPETELVALEKDLGAYGTAGQLQQRPSPRSGGQFKPDRIRIIKECPVDTIAKVRAWDTGATEGGGDYTVGVRLSQTREGRVVIEHVARGQWGTDERKRTIRQTAEMDTVRTSIWGEQEGGSAGKDAALDFVRLLGGFNVRTEHPTGDKSVRAQPFADQIEAGNVDMVAGAWNQDYLDELRMFPAGAHDDQVDASSLAYNKLARMAFQSGTAKADAAPVPVNLGRAKW